MRAGRLSHRITIKSLSSTRDTTGAPTETPVDVCTVWANVGYISGRERWANENVVNNYNVSVLIRARAGLAENMQVHHGDRVLDIKAILPEPNGLKSDMILLCVDHG